MIGSDFYDEYQDALFDDETVRRVNAFDWDVEFAQIMKSGGFDAVIGNPPYVRSQNLQADQRDYFNKKFATSTGTFDIYVLCVEKARDIINSNGSVGFIIPNKFFTTDYGDGLRGLLTKNNLVDKLVDFEDAQIFHKAGTYTTLIFLDKKNRNKSQYISLGDVFRQSGSSGLSSYLNQSKLTFHPIPLPSDSRRWSIAVGPEGELLNRLKKKYPKIRLYNPHIFQGLKTSADKVYLVNMINSKKNLFEVENQLGERFEIESEILEPVVRGENVGRYYTDKSIKLFIIYPYRIDGKGNAKLYSEHELAENYPNAWDYLNHHKGILGSRDKGKWSKRNDWYAYARAQNIGTFLGSKFLVPYMTTRLRADFDESGNLFFVNISTGGYGLRIKIDNCSDHYVLALLNSKLLNCCIKLMTNRFRGGYFAINKQAFERLPIKSIDFSKSSELKIHDKIVILTNNIRKLLTKLNDTKIHLDNQLISKQVKVTDRQIDQLVYQLYGLTKEEIMIVEESVK